MFNNILIRTLSKYPEYTITFNVEFGMIGRQDINAFEIFHDKEEIMLSWVSDGT